MNAQLSIKMKKGRPEPGASAPADVTPRYFAFAVGGCWRLLALVGAIFSQIKGLVVYQPVANIPGTAPSRGRARMRPAPLYPPEIACKFVRMGYLSRH
jgi:hypothetical protein